MTRTDVPDGPAGPVRWLVVVVAVAPVLGAVVVATAGAVASNGLARLGVTAVVYAPVAVVALTARRGDVALVSAALAVTSGWLVLGLALLEVRPGAVPRDLVLGLAHLLRLAEVGALALMPWLVAGAGSTRHRAGAATGASVVAVTAATWTVTAVTPVPVAVLLLPWAAALTSFVVGAVVLARRWRADPRRRRVGAWFVIGASLLVLSYARLAVPGPQELAWVLDAAFVLAQVFLPVGLIAAIAVRRPPRRALDAVVVVLALAAAVGSYLVVTAVLRALGVSTGTAGAVAAGGLALVLGAAVRSVRARLDPLFGDPVPDARQVLAGLGASAGGGGTEAALRDVARALRETWDLASVELVVAGNAATAGVGAEGTYATTLSLSTGGVTGRLTVTASDHELLERHVRPVLRSTAGLVAVAAQLAVTNEEVTSTRRRTFDVRREERRLLHDHLHDTLAPSLAGLGFAMVAVDRLLETNDPRLVEELDELRAQVAVSTASVRQLARVLLPTALDQGDLEAALLELADAVRGEGLAVRVQATGVDVLTADLQLAIYLLVAEALLLAVRVEAVEWAQVHVDVRVSEVVVGLRLGPDERPGADWRAVAEAVSVRSGELGGRASTDALGRVEAVLPR